MPLHIERSSQGVVTVWLDNAAKRNAMDDAMLLGLAQLLEEAEATPGVRALVIRGRHGTFCSGRDLSAVGSADGAPPPSAATRLAPIERLARAFGQCSAPVLAVVEGKAAGLGVSLVCWADITLVAADASLSIPEARAGIAPSVTAVGLAAVVGRRQALDLCLTGRSVGADEALSLGLAQHRCAQDQVDAALAGLLAGIAQGGPQALRWTKQLLQRTDGADAEAALAAAHATAVRSFDSAELTEGLRARAERRAPAWQQAAAPTPAPTATHS
jgi:enoyl-CoA hydratase/carnithine racemase